MTILDRGYRPLRYEPTRMPARLLAIAQIEAKSLFKSLWGLIAYLLCAAPMIAGLMILLVRVGLWEIAPQQMRQDVGESRLNPASIRFYLDPVVRESYLPFLIVTTLVSCRSIAKDRAAGALELLWTRAVSPWGYFVAKWCGSMLLLGSLFLACPLFLWVLAVFSADDWDLLARTAPRMPGFVLAVSTIVAVQTFLATAFSAFAGTPGFASMLWVGLVLGTSVVGLMLGEIFPDLLWLRSISPWEAANRIADHVCGVRRLREYPVEAALACLAGYVVAATLGLWKRLRTTEAVAA